jgi:UDP-N-acetylglucosamine 4-epimerase
MSHPNPYYETVKIKLHQKRKTWLVTGCAGFIGSHLVEHLLVLGQKVVGLDNFATGSRKNLNLVRQAVGPKTWEHFRFIRGDITRLADCYKALGIRPPPSSLHSKKPKKVREKSPIDIILHQAGLGSVPRSIANPLATHAVNVTGTLNLLVAARHAGVKRFVYAASSSAYGDSPVLPKREEKIGEALSPYAVSKYTDELYAKVFGRCYDLETVGLRYFNVFGPRQDPAGAYAAVIPRWIGEAMAGQRNEVHGDGKTSRDFCYVGNVVQANLLAAVARNPEALNQVYNVACGQATTLRDLHAKIKLSFDKSGLPFKSSKPRYLSFRKGDVRHSLASIAKAHRLLGYKPMILIEEGIRKTVSWYLS